MELRCSIQTGKGFVSTAIFSAAILGTVFAALEWMLLLPFALAGVMAPFVISILPFSKKKVLLYGLAGLLTVFLLVRCGVIWDGLKLLANQMFRCSEAVQSYEYDYFSVKGTSPVEAVVGISLLYGLLFARWGNRVNLGLAMGWCLVMAYFGVTPDDGWLLFLAAAGLVSMLPVQQRWFYGLLLCAVVAVIGLFATKLAPLAAETVSAWDDGLRDALAVQSVSYEQTPVPVEIPEPEPVPQPNVEQERPDHGVQRTAVNLLFLMLAALTLLLLFVPAVWKDRAAKLRSKNRAGIDDPDHAAAIRAMYLYARRWNALGGSPAVPQEIYAIWQEAAFSGHTMTEQQRQTMHRYLTGTAEAVWQDANWKKRLYIQYRLAL